MASYTNFMPGETLTAEKLNSAFSFLESKIDTLHLDAAPVEYVDRVVAETAAGTLSNANGYTDTAVATVNATVAGLAQSVNTIDNLLSSKANAADVYTKSQVDGLYDVLPQLAQGTLIAQIKTPAGTKPLYVPAFNPDWATNADVDDAIEEHLTDYVTSEDLDEALEDKADADSVYTKTQVDAALAGKVDQGDVYDKSEVYTKEEADALVSVEQRLTQGTVIARVTTPGGSVDLYAPQGGGGGGGVTIEEVDAEIEDYLEDYSTTAEVDAALAEKADASATYTKTEVDSAMADKADAATTYTKTEVDAGLAEKADADSVYTADQVDDLLGDKADAAEVYSKDQVDTALGAKADSDDVYPKTSVYTKSEVDALIPSGSGTLVTIHAMYPALYAGHVISATNGIYTVTDTVRSNGEVIIQCDELRSTGTWTLHDTSTAVNIGTFAGDTVVEVTHYGYYEALVKGCVTFHIPVSADRGMVSVVASYSWYDGSTRTQCSENIMVDPGDTGVIVIPRIDYNGYPISASLSFAESGAPGRTGVTKNYRSVSFYRLYDSAITVFHLYDDPTTFLVGGGDASVASTTATLTLSSGLDYTAASKQFTLTNGQGTVTAAGLNIGFFEAISADGKPVPTNTSGAYGYSTIKIAVGAKTTIASGSDYYSRRGPRLLSLAPVTYTGDQIIAAGNTFATVTGTVVRTAAHGALASTTMEFHGQGTNARAAIYLDVDLTYMHTLTILAKRTPNSSGGYYLCTDNISNPQTVLAVQASGALFESAFNGNRAHILEIDVSHLTGVHHFILDAGRNPDEKNYINSFTFS